MSSDSSEVSSPGVSGVMPVTALTAPTGIAVPAVILLVSALTSPAGVVAPAVVASTAPSGIALPTVMVSRPPMAEADPSGTGSVSSVVASTVTRTSLGSITGR